MNYQTTALWFYKPFYFLALLMCLGATFFGLSSPLFYIMMVGLALPVLVSMRVHTLSEAGKAWLVKDRSDWQVYVNGIPVQEQRSTLKNPCFSTPERLKQFYLRAFVCKLAIQLFALGMLWTQGREVELISLKALVEGIILFALLLIIASTVKTLRAIFTQKWELQSMTSDEGSHWYQAFFVDKKKAQPALGKLCSLI